MNFNKDSIPGLLEQIRQRHAELLESGAAQESQPLARRAFKPASAGGYEELAAYLGEQGVLAEVRDELLERVQGLRPASGSLEEALNVTETVLKGHWRSSPRSVGAGETHIFVGPPGAGKTTVLSKWLAQSVLLGGRAARVLRLDSNTANTAESLSVYGEVLGVPVLRSFCDPDTRASADVTFIDLPGTNANDSAALEDLRRQCARFPGAQVHLVLNGAYESSLLLAQVRAISSLPISDLIVAHLDEEVRWGKLINLLWSTDFPLGWLAAGQNVPGSLLEARPRHLLPRPVSHKTEGSGFSDAG